MGSTTQGFYFLCRSLVATKELPARSSQRISFLVDQLKSEPVLFLFEETGCWWGCDFNMKHATKHPFCF